MGGKQTNRHNVNFNFSLISSYFLEVTAIESLNLFTIKFVPFRITDTSIVWDVLAVREMMERVF